MFLILYFREHFCAKNCLFFIVNIRRKLRKGFHFNSIRGEGGEVSKYIWLASRNGKPAGKWILCIGIESQQSLLGRGNQGKFRLCSILYFNRTTDRSENRYLERTPQVVFSNVAKFALFFSTFSTVYPLSSVYMYVSDFQGFYSTV